MDEISPVNIKLGFSDLASLILGGFFIISSIQRLMTGVNDIVSLILNLIIGVTLILSLFQDVYSQGILLIFSLIHLGVYWKIQGNLLFTDMNSLLQFLLVRLEQHPSILLIAGIFLGLEVSCLVYSDPRLLMASNLILVGLSIVLGFRINEQLISSYLIFINAFFYLGFFNSAVASISFLIHRKSLIIQASQGEE